jgi:hypothetical protein
LGIILLLVWPVTTFQKKLQTADNLERSVCGVSGSLGKGSYPQVVSFFNELEIRKLCSKTVVSFFNEVATEMQKLSS